MDVAINRGELISLYSSLMQKQILEKLSEERDKTYFQCEDEVYQEWNRKLKSPVTKESVERLGKPSLNYIATCYVIDNYTPIID